MKRPRLLFASYHCFDDPSSGAALCTRDLFDLLTPRGWACGVATGPHLDFDRGGPVGQLLVGRQGVESLRGQSGNLTFSIYNSSAGGYPVSLFEPDPPSARRHPSPVEATSFLEFVERVVRRFRPDVVLTYGGDPASMGIVELSRRAGCKVAFWLHNYAYTSADLFRRCDAVIVPAEANRDHYRTALGIEPVVLPGPWNPARFLCERPDARFVTFINPEPNKGVFWFARIAEILGRERPDIPFLVVEGRGNVDWLGQCGIDLSGVRSVHRMKNTPDARDFYRVTRLILIPSLWREGLVRVAVEAMMNGIPVIGSGRGGLTESLRRGGIQIDIPARYTPEARIPPTNSEVAGWLECIVRLWDDPGAYREASDRARAGATEWHPDRLIPRWEQFLSGL